MARIRPMSDSPPRKRREKRPPKPLDSVRLRDLALAYVARYSTSTGKLENYLTRKLRERGWEDEAEPDVRGLIDRYVELGYIDDAAYAQSRSGGLLRRGFGARRVSQDLYAAGIDEHLREQAAPDEAAKRQAALTLARKRRFGPFYRETLDPARREKQIAAMLRAGHDFDTVRTILNAKSEDAAEEWAAEAHEEEF